LDAALRREVGRENDAHVELVPSEKRLLPEVIQQHAAMAGVTGVNVLVSLGMVKLLHAGGS
jgi:hypothetical protein